MIRGVGEWGEERRFCGVGLNSKTASGWALELAYSQAAKVDWLVNEYGQHDGRSVDTPGVSTSRKLWGGCDQL